MYCAGQQGLTTCKGDSGGGAIYHGFGIPVILGVTSFGQTKCQSFSTVFHKIESSLAWIKKVAPEVCKTSAKDLISTKSVPPVVFLLPQGSLYWVRLGLLGNMQWNCSSS